MLIFLDTEFTYIDVKNPRLISFGLIAEDGQTFYAELSDTPAFPNIVTMNLL